MNAIAKRTEQPSRSTTLQPLRPFVAELLEAEVTTWRFGDDSGPVNCGWALPRKVPMDAIDDIDDALGLLDAAPASEGEIRLMLGRLANHCVMANRTPEMYSALFADYIAALTGFTPLALEQARMEIIRTAQFFPRIAELLPLVERAEAKRKTLLRRAKFLRWCVKRFNGAVPQVRRLDGRETGLFEGLDTEIMRLADVDERPTDYQAEPGECVVNASWAVKFPKEQN